MSAARVPETAFVAALATLTGCGGLRLTRLLAAVAPEEAWHAVRDGRLGSVVNLDEFAQDARRLVERWRAQARHVDAADNWQALIRAGVNVWVRGRAGFPDILIDDPEPAPILFWKGDASALDAPSAAIVGTRRCTPYGEDVSSQLGRDLAQAGVSVVSGLALGIDGHAHRGALAVAGAPPIAVVAGGLDVIYPQRNRKVWLAVAERGLLISEAPLGTMHEAWRFRVRNRLIAGLSRVVVVVESNTAGGSMITVDDAAARGITVMAVPGSVKSPVSEGTNNLLANGSPPVRDAQDILVALSLSTVRDVASVMPEPQLEGETSAVRAVYRAVEDTATATEAVLRRTALPLGTVSIALTRLEALGAVRKTGGWWQRSGKHGG